MHEREDYADTNYAGPHASVQAAQDGAEARVSRYNTLARGPVVTLAVDNGEGDTAIVWFTPENAVRLATVLLNAVEETHEHEVRWQAYRDADKLSR